MKTNCDTCVKLAIGGYKGACISCGTMIEEPVDEKKLDQLESYLGNHGHVIETYDSKNYYYYVEQRALSIQKELLIRDYDLYVEIPLPHTCKNFNDFDCKFLTERQVLKKYKITKDELSRLVTKLRHNDQTCKMCIYGLFEADYTGYNGGLNMINPYKVLEYSKMKEYLQVYEETNKK